MNFEVYYLLQNSEFDIRYSIFNAFAFPETAHGHVHATFLPAFSCMNEHIFIQTEGIYRVRAYKLDF
jgi:hypothetical protein